MNNIIFCKNIASFYMKSSQNLWELNPISLTLTFAIKIQTFLHVKHPNRNKT